ncbi:class I SAM-dependent methyltransferase [Nocardiopsis dassonvillei]|uniref:class I SAM-dependent methyltransferase n=1 Tax=Nocardiopsis dassonvillei TaxID=2014 RepID=UPI003F56765E
MGRDTDRNRVHHPLFARFYMRAAGAMEGGGMAERRAALLGGLSGKVLEIGAGDGRNFGHYPAAVRRVVAVEPEPHLRAAARRAAKRAPVPVEVVDGTAERLPFAEASFDAAVATLVLCSVADQRTVLREVHRVLRPQGRCYFLEHVRADTPGMRRAQRWVDATVGPRLLGGCRCGRDTVARVEEAGFALARLDRFLMPALRTPQSFHVSGEAVRVDLPHGAG